MTTENEMQHVIVTGHGRSGTNLVLDLLDTSPHTICRNEANEIRDACLNQLEPGFFPPETQDSDVFWTLLNKSIYYRSNRDRFRYWHKEFYNQAPLQSAYLGMLRYAHLRKALHPWQSGKEWRLPEGIYDKQSVAAAVAVHKILLWPGRLLTAHSALEQLRIVHVIRNPEDFLQSWYARYVLERSGGPEQVFRDNHPSANRIMSYFGRDGQALYSDGFELEALIESEMWRWRYVNEILFKSLKDSQRYLIITYSDATRRTVDVAERLTDFCGLEFSSQMRARIQHNENTLFARRKKYSLNPELAKSTVRRVLSDSPLKDLIANTSSDDKKAGIG